MTVCGVPAFSIIQTQERKDHAPIDHIPSFSDCCGTRIAAAISIVLVRFEEGQRIGQPACADLHSLHTTHKEAVTQRFGSQYVLLRTGSRLG
jgi:hypothetical protein